MIRQHSSSIQETLDIFELFDWWQPQQLAKKTGLNVDKLKSFIKTRKEFNRVASNLDQSNLDSLSEKQIQLAENFSSNLSPGEYKALKRILPKRIDGNKFDFVDLFAGIGGIRKPFSDIGGRCLLTCEWDKYAQKTYKANWQNDQSHQFISDIKSITQPQALTGNQQAQFIDEAMPDHDVLLAGFPCQPFSIAGVSKKNALNRAHGFDCKDQGQLFFDICRILSVKQPAVALLENVKNLKSHNKGHTFQVIKDMLNRLPDYQKLLFGHTLYQSNQPYWIANINDEKPDPKIIDGKHFVPQHRERIILLCIRMDIAKALKLDEKIDLNNINKPAKTQNLKTILEFNHAVDKKYTLSDKLWNYLKNYAEKHKAKGNGFGYSLIDRDKNNTITRTLSARYHKDGSEILVNQHNINKRPRRLTPQECARLMGFATKKAPFNIPVSDTRAYKQFGNSVIVPVFGAVADLLDEHILPIKAFTQTSQ